MSETNHFPVDLAVDPEDARPGLGWTSVSIGVATAILFFANAASIDNWTREMEPTAATLPWMQMASQWRATTESWGLGSPRAVVHTAWKQAEGARWTSEAPETQSASAAADQR